MQFIASCPDTAYRDSLICQLKKSADIAVASAGESLCGRDIPVLTAGHGSQKLLVCAGIHGSEYLTVLCALRFLMQVQLMQDVSLSVVPCVNPDGTEIALNGSAAAGCYEAFLHQNGGDCRSWQANARGVDINHNFAACWHSVKQRELAAGITAPAPTRFGGFYPESEPETRALTRLCRQNSYVRVLALHSQGREIYWDFHRCTPTEGLRLAEQMAQASGYRVASPEPMAIGGGFKDWFLQQFSRPGFTLEIGKGKNPLPLSDFEEEYPRVKRALQVFCDGA